MTAQQLKNSILQMAVQGKLVPQDPNDEPASVLLERIRAEKQKLIKEGKIKPEKNPSVIFRGEDNLPYEKVGDKEPVCIADEVPFEIPESWEWVRLSTIIELQSGQDLTPDKYNDSHRGMPYITGASNIADESVIINRWTEYGRAFAYKGNLLLTCKGTVGTMAFLKEEQVHIARQIMAIKPYWGVNPLYLKIVLETLVEKFKATAKSMIPGISREDVLTAFFPIPPVNEQDKIVEKLYDILPQLTAYGQKETEIKTLNESFPTQLQKSILQQAVMGKLVPQDDNDEPASVLLEKIHVEKTTLIKAGKLKKDKHESEIYRRDNSHYEKLDDVERCIDDEIPFEIPDSWIWMRLGNLLQIESGKGLTSKEMKQGIIPVYGGNGITGYHDKAILHSSTIVIGRVGFYCGSVHITESEAWVTDNAFIVTYPENNIYREFLVYALKYMNLGKNNNATAQPVVSGKKIYPMLIPIPPYEEQKRISAKLDNVLWNCDNLNLQNKVF